ncbi:TIGR00645 family protein [Luteimonas sp. Y-2-2-4F]|nr:TIGR00645 family protein [Luteimonas sp. Y-2-2-4F]MCD9032489.1 TIGR00645 family protein [Luteimonas sp. Y-2-2-4F]
MPPLSRSSASRPLNPLAALIFSSRWLQLPLYLGLIVAQGVYVFLFVKELWHLIHSAASLSEQAIMLIVLSLIDVVMISNLLVMVIVGGYETFVSRLRLEGHPDQPEWLSHVNASVLKVKLAMAIIGISSIHLLKTFIEASMAGGLPLCGTVEALQAAQAYAQLGGTASARTCTTYTPSGIMWQAIIHAIFILSAIGIAWTDRLMQHTASRREHHAE